MKEGRGSDSKLVSALATQLGYFPQFQWASSFNNLIDIASVGLIGTKAGFSTNLDVQIKQVRASPRLYRREAICEAPLT